MIKVLFVCSRNKWRSLTAETIFSNKLPGIDVRSAGTEQGARIKVTEGLLGWADLIFVMEKRHRQRLEQRYPQALIGKRIVRMDIPDVYPYMDEELISLLAAGVAEFIELPEDFSPC